MVLYSLTKFDIEAIVHGLGKLYLRLCQTSKQIYNKIQYTEKVFEEFQGLSDLPRKIIYYLFTRLDLTKPWTNIIWLRRFDLFFWQTEKQIYRKFVEISIVMRILLQSFNSCPSFPKNGLVLVDKFWYCEALNQIFHVPEDSIYAFDRLINKFARNSIIRKKFVDCLEVCLVTLLGKWLCILGPNLPF